MLHASAGLLALLISPVPPGHVSPHLRAAGPFMCAPPLVATEIEGMAYRQLQQLCKAHGLGAKGKADELRQRLLDAAGSPASAPPAAPPAAPTERLQPAPHEAGLDGVSPAEDGAAEKAGDGDGDFDDSLFDELLAELSDGDDENFYGTFNAPGAPAAGGGNTAAAAPADPLGPIEDESMKDALDALAELDLDIDADGPSAAAPGGGTNVDGNDDGFDESWLDDLFGPIDAAQPGARAPPSATDGAPRTSSPGRGDFRPAYAGGTTGRRPPRGAGGGGGVGTTRRPSTCPSHLSVATCRMTTCGGRS